MQQATCTGIRVRSTADAHRLLYAVQLGLLHMVTRRLDSEERLALQSGCVYVWEERQDDTALTSTKFGRFTDGRKWSPSRVRDDFLFYYEKFVPPSDKNHLGKAVAGEPPADWDQLVRQTYSAFVETKNGRRKWHLTTYFSQGTIDDLKTVDDNPLTQHLVVPPGTFQSTRARVSKSRSKAEDNVRSKVARASVDVPRIPIPPYKDQDLAPVLLLQPYPSNESKLQASTEPLRLEHVAEDNSQKLVPISDNVFCRLDQTDHATAKCTVIAPHVVAQPHSRRRLTSRVIPSSMHHLRAPRSDHRSRNDRASQASRYQAYYQYLETRRSSTYATLRHSDVPSSESPPANLAAYLHQVPISVTSSVSSPAATAIFYTRI